MEIECSEKEWNGLDWAGIVTYSQYPGFVTGLNAVEVHMSYILPAAPPCMTPKAHILATPSLL